MKNEKIVNLEKMMREKMNELNKLRDEYLDKRAEMTEKEEALENYKLNLAYNTLLAEYKTRLLDITA